MSTNVSSPGSPNPFQSPPMLPPPRHKSVLWVIGIGLLASMCLCGGPCIGLVGVGVYQAVTQRGPVEQVIDASMRDIEAGRTDEVLARVSKRAIEHDIITREEIEELEDNPAFQNYESLHVTHTNVSATFNTDAKVPQGTVANVSGTVAYQDGGKGTFQATLEKEKGEWRLYSLSVKRDSAGAMAEKPGDMAEKPSDEVQ